MTGTWETIDLAGHAVDVFTPGERREDAVLLVLPDHGERASDDMALVDALERSRVSAIAPTCDGCWWLDRVEPVFDPELPPLRFLTDHVVPAIGERFGVRPPGVKLLGREAGGQGVLQLAFRRPQDFPAVAAVNPAIDFHELHGRGTPLDDLFPNREAARQETAILRMQGVGWPRRMLLLADPQGDWFDGSDRLDMKLRSMGIPLEADFTKTTGGDGRRFFERHVTRAVEFLMTERVTLPVVRGQEL